MSDTPPVILCILDGWGHGAETPDNGIYMAHTPHWDALWTHSPHCLLEASEQAVGLPDDQMGNSEVGHTNIGAGRVVYQDLPRINTAIDENTLSTITELQTYISTLQASGGTCHLMGLLSTGGIHSHQGHILALANIIQSQGIPVVFHAFLDGRDTPPKSAKDYLASLLDFCQMYPSCQIGTLGGRYYAMDRDKRWQRTQLAYQAMVSPEASPRSPTALEALENSYAQGVTDEFLIPTALGEYEGMKEEDGLLMANFRADRARQILEAFLDPDFSAFEPIRRIDFSTTLGMVEYSERHNTWLHTLFPPLVPEHTLGEVVSKQGLSQLRIAETEKYAHVTFFFNGGRETPFPHEDRILIPSPDVATYDLQPEMSAAALTDQLVSAITSKQYGLIVVNYANTDMVGHTGNQKAVTKAVETVDTALGRILKATTQAGGKLCVTADHGNAEVMHNLDSGQPHTAHTLNPVPFVLYTAENQGYALRDGSLADVSPTILELMDIPQPKAMTGKSLLV